LISSYRASLAEKLAEVTPKEITRVTFGVSGGEAVDFAIKLARGYTGRHKIIYARGGYHGHTGLALAAGDDQYKKPFEPLAPGFVSVPFGDLEALAKVLDNETAAVLFETIPATLGMPIPSEDFYKGVRDLCDDKGALLILDEIQTGLGRTGRLWGFEHYDVVPDIFVIGKGLSGGLYPITATLYKEEIDGFMKEHPFIHISTFGGAELGCLVAIKVLDITSDPAFLDHVNRVSVRLREIMNEIRDSYNDILIEIRQKGLFIGLKMSDDGYGPLLTIGAYNNGILAVYANNDRSVLQFLPPLIIGDEELGYIEENLRNAYQWAREHSEYLSLIKSMIHT
jgi:acetylornithine/succinyldiaminopimelate/putrescine aminotransferase